MVSLTARSLRFCSPWSNVYCNAIKNINYLLPRLRYLSILCDTDKSLESGKLLTIPKIGRRPLERTDYESI